MPAVLRFASDVLVKRRRPVTPYWLTVLGPSGVGKTLLLAQLFRKLANNTERWPIRTRDDGSERSADCAHVIPGQDLNDHKAPSYFGRFDLLYIEDAGAMGNRGAGAVINDRTTELLLYRPRKWTLIDSNLTLDEFAGNLDPRIVSRLKRDGSILIELSPEIPDYNFRP